MATTQLSIQNIYHSYAVGGVTDDVIGYIVGQGHYRLRIAFETKLPLSALQVALDFVYGDVDADPVFYAALTNSASTSHPSTGTVFGFTSGYKTNFTLEKQMLPGTWYLWLFQKSGQTTGSYVQRLTSSSLTGTLSGTGKVYQNGAWQTALAKRCSGGAWETLLPKVYKDGAWETLC